jgi:phytoene/squalene synthetase
MLDKKYREPIYSIYGFVRLADEIVDSFEGYNQSKMLKKLKKDTFLAISEGISTNPVLNSFQNVVNKYKIDLKLVELFLNSMKMDLKKVKYDKKTLKTYILGSAEVVGLMCLKVFVEGDDREYKNLEVYAKTLGSAFQKINFLRDVNEDYNNLGRIYFPNLDLNNFTEKNKKKIENDLEDEFKIALFGVLLLPRTVKVGVLISYRYYYELFRKIKQSNPEDLMVKRVRISNFHKMWILFKTFFEYLLFLR